jgi:hypothetical protein
MLYEEFSFIKASSDDEYGDDNYEDPYKDNDNECDCPDDDDDYYEEPPREEEDER